MRMTRIRYTLAHMAEIEVERHKRHKTRRQVGLEVNHCVWSTNVSISDSGNYSDIHTPCPCAGCVFFGLAGIILGLVLKPPQPPHPHNPHTPTTLDDHGGCGVVGV